MLWYLKQINLPSASLVIYNIIILFQNCYQIQSVQIMVLFMTTQSFVFLSFLLVLRKYDVTVSRSISNLIFLNLKFMNFGVFTINKQPRFIKLPSTSLYHTFTAIYVSGIIIYVSNEWLRCLTKCLFPADCTEQPIEGANCSCVLVYSTMQQTRESVAKAIFVVAAVRTLNPTFKSTICNARDIVIWLSRFNFYFQWVYYRSMFTLANGTNTMPLKPDTDKVVFEINFTVGNTTLCRRFHINKSW